jgi:uncharacterized protein
MKITVKYFLISFLLFAFATTTLHALPIRPEPPRLVNDFENLLTPAQASALENKLVNYERTHTTQIAVVITNDLGGLEISDFSFRLGSAWGVGQAGFENGIVITVVPQQRETFIATGYGLEGRIPDITAKQIIDNGMLPHFLNGNYYQGLDQATDQIMQKASEEFAASETAAQEEVPPGALLFPFLLVIVMVVLLSRRRRSFHEPGKNIPFWTLFWLLSSGSRGRSGSFGNFSSGRGSFGPRGGSFGGGMGGGGFGGFGGGRFGGGGAGGRW